MADRVLHWHLPGGVSLGTHPMVYELDAEYMALRLWAHVTDLPGDADLLVDVTADGVSVLDTPLRVPRHALHDTVTASVEREHLSERTLEAGSLVRLVTSSDTTGSTGHNLNVQLELHKE